MLGGLSGAQLVLFTFFTLLVVCLVLVVRAIARFDQDARRPRKR
jgi:hypothetical protein